MKKGVGVKLIALNRGETLRAEHTAGGAGIFGSEREDVTG